MASTKTQPARGMRDFLPEDVRRREYVIGVIKEVYERYGFEPLETPAVENIETLLGKYGEEGNQLIFKILKRGVHEGTGEADLALRYDLTVPLARVVAEYRDKLPKFFKRYQIQPVWRADRPARGRFREFYQCDVDVLGSKSMVVEAELCGAVNDVLSRLGFINFTIVLNHRRLLSGILHVAGVPTEKHADALIALDKLNKIGAEGVLREFREREVLLGDTGKTLITLFADVGVGLVGSAYETAERAGESLLSATESKAMNNAILERLEDFVGSNEEGLAGIAELREILEYLTANGVITRAEINPSLARGLSYYTGAIFEIEASELSGSLGGGGRYDSLVGMFSGQQVPACGFSLGLERIIVVMSEQGMFPADLASTSADVMVLIWYHKDKGEKVESARESMELATQLRAAEIRVDLYPVRNVEIRKQMAYASKREIPFVAFIGDDERARGEVAIKDMRSGEQRSVKREDVAAVIRNWER